MNNFLKKILSVQKIDDEEDIFFLNRLMGDEDIKFDELNIKFIISSTMSLNEAEIENKIWKIRESIMLQAGSIKKLARCVDADISIKERYFLDNDTKRKLVAKLIINYYIFLSP